MAWRAAHLARPGALAGRAHPAGSACCGPGCVPGRSTAYGPRTAAAVTRLERARRITPQENKPTLRPALARASWGAAAIPLSGGTSRAAGLAAALVLMLIALALVMGSLLGGLLVAALGCRAGSGRLARAIPSTGARSWRLSRRSAERSPLPVRASRCRRSAT